MLELLTIACTITAILAARNGAAIVASAAVLSMAALVLAHVAIN